MTTTDTETAPERQSEPTPEPKPEILCVEVAMDDDLLRFYREHEGLWETDDHWDRECRVVRDGDVWEWVMQVSGRTASRDGAMKAAAAYYAKATKDGP